MGEVGSGWQFASVLSTLSASLTWERYMAAKSQPAGSRVSAMAGSCKIQLEAVQTVVPIKPTLPRICSKLLLPPPHDLNSIPITAAAFHIVLFFHKASAGDSGWLQAAVIKESLSHALVERPIFSGRLRPCDEDVSVMEIVSNDSGVRLLEAKAGATVAEFLEAAGDGGARKLVFWEDLPQQNPQFSPLFYVQVTNFSCGGYSVGFSGSLLLADPFAAITFLETWIKIHRQLASKIEASRFPMFYHPHLKRPAAESHLDLLLPSTTRIPAADCVVFDIPLKSLKSDHMDLAARCVNRAEREVGRKMSAKFCVLIKAAPENDAEILVVSRLQGPIELEIAGGVSLTRGWDQMGLASGWLKEGVKPDFASFWISVTEAEQGSVLVAPGSDGTKVVVLFP